MKLDNGMFIVEIEDTSSYCQLFSPSQVLAGAFFTTSHLGSSYVQNIRQLIYFKINEQKSKQIILVAVYRAIYIVSIKTKPSPTLAAAAAKSLQSCPTLHVPIDILVP